MQVDVVLTTSNYSNADKPGKIVLTVSLPVSPRVQHLLIIITARCTLVQSAVLRSHVVCPSVCLSVCNVGEL